MTIWSTKPSEPGSPGIDVDGVGTMNVAGHEVPLAAYWRIVALSDSGRSPFEIVDQVMKTTDAASHPRFLIVRIVDSIVENLHLIQGSGFNPDDKSRMSRASIIFNPNKPMRFSAFRPSKLSAKPETSESWEQLHATQQREAEVVTEALKMLTQEDTIKKAMPGSVLKRMTEAAIDESVQMALKEHETAGGEVRKAKKLVKRNRMTMV